MYLATVTGARLPVPTLPELRDGRMRSSALLHLVAAGGDPSLNENVPPARRVTNRIPKIGAAMRILLAHNPALVNFGLWTLVAVPLARSIESLTVNLLQLEHDCMHHEHARPSAWRHCYESALVELLSSRPDLTVILFGYRHWPESLREQFISWNVLPALAIILAAKAAERAAQQQG